MTITTIKTYKCGGRQARVTTDAVDVEVTLDKGGRVGWASDWLAIHTLVDAGLARTEFFRNCWGHTDVFIS